FHLLARVALARDVGNLHLLQSAQEAVLERRRGETAPLGTPGLPGIDGHDGRTFGVVPVTHRAPVSRVYQEPGKNVRVLAPATAAHSGSGLDRGRHGVERLRVDDLREVPGHRLAFGLAPLGAAPVRGVKADGRLG